MTPRSSKLLALTIAALLGPAGLRAQSAPAPAAADTSDKAAVSPLAPGSDTPPAKSPAMPKPAAPHEISSETASLLAAGRPKFDPPKATPPPKPDDQLVDLRDVDKPKNQIVRLPKVVVNEKPPPIFSQRELNTHDGVEDIAMRTYLADPRNMSSMTAAAQQVLFGGYALEQYRERERLNNMASLKDSADMFQRAGDSAETSALKNASDDTFLRRGDFGTSAPDVPSALHPFQYLDKADVSPSSP